MGSFFTAKKAVDENAQRFISSTENPVMWNINAALSGMIDGLSALERKVSDLEQKLVYLSHQVDRLR